MAQFWGINENEIESGYFWEVPSENPLVRLGVLEKSNTEPSALKKVFNRQKTERAEREKPSFIEKVSDFASNAVSLWTTFANWDQWVEDRQEFKKIWKAEELLAWITEKTIDSASGGIDRIQEAWEGIATWEFDVDEWLIRGAAWALQTFFSPIGWVLWEWAEQSIKAMSDDFKASVVEWVTPTIETITTWYNNQSPEQQRELNNVWVWLELLLEFAWVAKGKQLIEDFIKKIWRTSHVLKRNSLRRCWITKRVSD